jgi:hypothetical protein
LKKVLGYLGCFGLVCLVAILAILAATDPVHPTIKVAIDNFSSRVCLGKAEITDSQGSLHTLSLSCPPNSNASEEWRDPNRKQPQSIKILVDRKVVLEEPISGPKRIHSFVIGFDKDAKFKSVIRSDSH